MILTSCIVLAVIGIIAAFILWIAAKRFHVHEDPNIELVEEILPGANCGGCGFSGCHAFACACCEAENLEGLKCPGAGEEGMKKIAEILGLNAVASNPNIAIVRCQGTCSLRPKTSNFDGPRSCAIEALCYAGDSACQFGCLGCGDCVEACPYDAMHLDEETGLPVVNIDKCVGCAKCVKACPKNIIELAPRYSDHDLVYVACMNAEKGGTAMKECEVACIGCTKCRKVCESEAVTIASFLSHIDYDKCIGCGACIEACPRNSILKISSPA